MTKRTKTLIKAVIVTIIISAWGTYNYTNYMVSKATSQRKIDENIAMVDKSTEVLQQQKTARDTTVERRYTRVRDPAGELLFAMPPPSPYQPRDLIQEEIDALRAEKYRMAREIEQTQSLTNKMSPSNPYINTLAIPVLLLFCSKGIDLGYKILCKKCGVDDE